MNGNINDSNDGGIITGTARANQHSCYADDEKLSTAVVMALAEVAGDDPAEMGMPLYDAIDPDALDTLFSDKHDGTPRMGGKVVFDILNYQVTVHSYGQIVISELD
ncbi:HalOD1 output domain-containing protein [Haladaptatus caseinilyticus]|uniref:HalOD1 output domain-containing protein n=1 Tax=Haladaptatus caseinilyticus TaxID=2993314 RepID=UPI00224B2753|nr:HalOD1 output domain-containing protein [Haladaptatus caseinilyticus]